MDAVTRRGFLKGIVGLAAGLAAPSLSHGLESLASTPAPKVSAAVRPRVIVARDPGVAHGWDVDPARLADLLDRGVRAWGGVTDAREVWRDLFDPKDTVGIKVNALAGIPASTHPELAMAVAAALSSIGIRDRQVVVWDRAGSDLARAGFTLNESGNGWRCLGTDAPGAGYDSEHSFFGKVGSRVSRIQSSLTSASVNLPVLKDHGLAGVSGALKNTYGAIHNPNKYHANHCNPWVADVNALPAVRRKARLVVCDALYGLCHGGPGFKEPWAWNFGGILVGSDPVAVDRIEWQIIEERRASLGLKSLTEEGRPPAWLETASDADHALGVSALDRIERVDV
jgi:uncharacterized protein (DUF362 family)